MAVKTPLKVSSGEVQQFQSGDIYDPAFNNISQSNRTASDDVSILAGYSGIVVRKYTIALGKKVIIESGAILRIQ